MEILHILDIRQLILIVNYYYLLLISFFTWCNAHLIIYMQAAQYKLINYYKLLL